MKKGIMMGQVITYIVALVVMALILGYGYKAIVDIGGRVEKVSVIKFENELKSKIKALSSQFRSERQVEMALPAEIIKVCFADFDWLTNDIGGTAFDSSDSAICKTGGDNYDEVSCALWTSKDSNVFFFPANADPLRVEQIQVDYESPQGGSVCGKVSGGRIKLRLEGTGSRTIVEVQ
jgi:hypothetical protein